LNVKTNGAIQTVNLVVKPVIRPETMQGLMMVIFEDVQAPKISRSSKKNILLKK